MPEDSLVFVVIFGGEAELRMVGARTKRSLVLHGVRPANIQLWNSESLGSNIVGLLRSNHQGVWFIQAGAWISPQFGLRTPVHFPSRHAKGQRICAVGRLSLWEEQQPNKESNAWDDLLGNSLGHLSPATLSQSPLPRIRSCYLEASLTSVLLEKMQQGYPLQAALAEIAKDEQVRTVHWQALDIHFDESIRIAQVITSLQRGGAERMAIDLHRHLRHHRISSLLLGLGPPSRDAFPIPRGARDLSTCDRSHLGRLARCGKELEIFAPDLLHVHLLKNQDVKQLALMDIPVVATIHNMRDGWPDALEDLNTKDVSLLIACSKVVERDLRNANLSIPCRTVWNGIDVQSFSPVSEPSSIPVQSESSFDAGLHSGKVNNQVKEFVMVAIANPRPQKRLEKLPAIAALLQSKFIEQGSNRRVRLLIAGQASQWSSVAQESDRLLKKAIAESRMEKQIELLGPVSDIQELLSKANVLVSAAAFEGLSLAHLEALACDVPVVATDVGGTCEIASRSPGLTLVSADATDEMFVESLVQIAGSAGQSSSESIRREFSVTTMSMAYLRLYQRVISTHFRPEQDREQTGEVLFIMNNLSTGGAQSSARRLMMALHARGVPVRVAILEELAQYPTEGRQTLVDAGIPVLVLEPAGSIDPLLALQPLFHCIDGSPPKSIVFWNAISEYKMLIADNVWGIPIVDVSPGEMYYSSMDKYFQRPRSGLPYMDLRDYGDRLSSMVVKYQAEQLLARERLGTDVHVVPNGVPLHTPVNLDRQRQEIVIGTVARISHQKKLEELIEATRIATPAMPRFRVQIVGGVERGSEDYASRLGELSQGLNIDWIGEKSDPSESLRSWDMFVLISEPAGCPNAGLEAMSHGLPLIATDVGGASEQVIDGVNGRLVTRGDVQGLADAMVALAHSVELRMMYGEASHQRAAGNFSLEKMIARYQTIFGFS